MIPARPTQQRAASTPLLADKQRKRIRSQVNAIAATAREIKEELLLLPRNSLTYYSRPLSQIFPDRGYEDVLTDALNLLQAARQLRRSIGRLPVAEDQAETPAPSSEQGDNDE